MRLQEVIFSTVENLRLVPNVLLTGIPNAEFGVGQEQKGGGTGPWG